MAYVGGLGFPVPEVEAAAGTDLVMERLDGPTLADALATGTVGVEEGARSLAALHTRLHALPARISPDPAIRVLHLDLHPANVLLSSRGPVVIDWRNTAEGPPELDVALTALIMAEVAVGDPVADLADLAAATMRMFLAHAGTDICRALAQATAQRAADPYLSPQEVQRVPRAAALVVDAGSHSCGPPTVC